MPILNGEIAYSSGQRNNSYIFVDLETDFDSANTLMTTSGAAKLGIRCKLLAWIRDYLVRSEANQRIDVKCQGRVSGAHVFLNGIPKSVSCRDLFLHDSEASHTPRISTKGHCHLLCIRCAHCNQQTSYAYHPASFMHHK